MKYDNNKIYKTGFTKIVRYYTVVVLNRLFTYKDDLGCESSTKLKFWS